MKNTKFYFSSGSIDPLNISDKERRWFIPNKGASDFKFKSWLKKKLNGN